MAALSQTNQKMNEAIAAYQASLDAKISKAELLVQFNTLRAEILERMNLRQQILTIALAGVGMFLLVLLEK